MGNSWALPRLPWVNRLNHTGPGELWVNSVFYAWIRGKFYFFAVAFLTISH